MNSTTIQIRRETLNQLKSLKKEINATTYDEVITYLIRQEHNIPQTLFGFLKNKTTSYKRDEVEEDHEF